MAKKVKSTETTKLSREELLQSIGCQVACPVTNDDNEQEYKIGTLVTINSRFATVIDSDGEKFKVGITKVELLMAEPDHKSSSSRDYSRYISVRAASGRKSLDNGDKVARSLRGQTLDFAYKVTAAHLEVSEKTLRNQYGHLNPGQQRMLLGNKLRNY